MGCGTISYTYAVVVCFLDILHNTKRMKSVHCEWTMTDNFTLRLTAVIIPLSKFFFDSYIHVRTLIKCTF